MPLLKDFSVKPKPTLVEQPQSNVIVERVQQVVGGMIRMYELKEHIFDEIDPWGLVLHTISWLVRSTYHTTNQASSG